MGIAYSPPDRVIHADIDASTSVCIRNGLHLAVQKAGWEIDMAITNGYVYLLTSPQRDTLQMKVQIQDTGRHPVGRNVIDVIFMSADEVNKSTIFVLQYGAGLRLRAHITPCQIFTYRPGRFDLAGAVMGGVPFIDPNALSGEPHCADDDNGIETVTAWWACSDLSTADYVRGVTTFRNSWVASCNASQHNSEFRTWVNLSGTGADGPQVRLVPPNKPTGFAYNFGNNNFAYPVMMRWQGTDEPLCFDPFIAWALNHPVKIRGQIWDAFIRTKHVPPEQPFIMDDIPFFAYSSNPQEGTPAHWYQTTDICTLYLREPGLTTFGCTDEPPSEPTESNYVY